MKCTADIPFGTVNWKLKSRNKIIKTIPQALYVRSTLGMVELVCSSENRKHQNKLKLSSNTADYQCHTEGYTNDTKCSIKQYLQTTTRNDESVRKILRENNRSSIMLFRTISVLVRNHCIIGFKTIFIRKSTKLEVLKNRLSSVMCTFNFTLTARVTSLRVSIFDSQPI